MGYDGKVMRRAMARYNEEKAHRAQELSERKQKLYAAVPRLGAIEQELSATMSQIITGALAKGTDPLPAIRVIRDKNLDLQRERMELLLRNGYPEDYLEEKPACRICGDTGYVNGQMCPCLQRVYREEQNKELSKMLDLGNQKFETFSFDWYSTAPDPETKKSPRQRAEKNFDACRDYAYQFSQRSGNLLLCGKPGLGKTFLSACIARVVSDKGFSVVYDTASHVFGQMERVRFRREEEPADAAEDVKRYENCDLLILDDLGTEMTTAFVRSALYDLIDQRLRDNKKTVINSNMDADDIGNYYSPQIRSRILGNYEVLPFFGEDIRYLKRKDDRKR